MLRGSMPTLWGNDIVFDSTNEDYWRSQTWVTGTTLTPLDASLVGGHMVVLTWTRTVSAGLREDIAETAFHFSTNAGPGAPCSPLNSATMASIEGFLGSWWSAVRTVVSNGFTLRDYSWRQFKASNPVGISGAVKYDPVSRLTSVANVGADTGSRLPDQVSATISQHTASRRHWGRSYIPGVTINGLSASYGHLSTAYVTNLADNTRTMFNQCAGLAAITNPVIWSPTKRGIMSINKLDVDDVADVIRRRRAKQPVTRKSWTS